MERENWEALPRLIFFSQIRTYNKEFWLPKPLIFKPYSYSPLNDKDVVGIYDYIKMWSVFMIILRCLGTKVGSLRIQRIESE